MNHLPADSEAQACARLATQLMQEAGYTPPKTRTIDTKKNFDRIMKQTLAGVRRPARTAPSFMRDVSRLERKPRRHIARVTRSTRTTTSARQSHSTRTKTSSAKGKSDPPPSGDGDPASRRPHAGSGVAAAAVLVQEGV